MKTARVIVTQECRRNCAYCVNKQNDGAMVKGATLLEDIKQLTDFDTVLITGGEPLLEYDRTMEFLYLLRDARNRGDRTPGVNVYIYATSLGGCTHDQWASLLRLVDGVTWTIHYDVDDPNTIELDIKAMEFFQRMVRCYPQKTFQLNLAPDIDVIVGIIPEIWSQIKVKTWAEDCPLPADEELFILKEAM